MNKPKTEEHTIDSKSHDLTVHNQASVNSVWNSVYDSIWNSVRDSVDNSVRASGYNLIHDSVYDSVSNSAWYSIIKNINKHVDENR